MQTEVLENKTVAQLEADILNGRDVSHSDLTRAQNHEAADARIQALREQRAEQERQAAYLESRRQVLTAAKQKFDELATGEIHSEIAQAKDALRAAVNQFFEVSRRYNADLSEIHGL